MNAQDAINHLNENENFKIIYSSGQVTVFEEMERYSVNLVALSGPDGVIMLDTGFKKCADELISAVDALHSGDVIYIINSHIDRDHVEANGTFGCEVTYIGHENCDSFFKEVGAKSITFDDRYSFNFNGMEIICTARPGGHTTCDIVVHIPALKTVYLGDIYFSQSFPRVDYPTGSKAQVLLGYLKEIHAQLPEDTMVIPGHGRVTTMNELGKYIEMVETTMKIVKEEMDKGKSLQEIQQADVLRDWGDWGQYFTFINKNTWIENVYFSY